MQPGSSKHYSHFAKMVCRAFLFAYPPSFWFWFWVPTQQYSEFTPFFYSQGGHMCYQESNTDLLHIYRTNASLTCISHTLV